MSHDYQSEWIGVRLDLPRAIVEAAIIEARRQGGDAAGDRTALARAILRSRRRRGACFPEVDFGEPSWDMLLELYAAHGSSNPLDVTSLCAACEVPKTTALRHLDRLVERGLVMRSDDPGDSRRHLVHATEVLLPQIERWLDIEFGLRAISVS